jgi:hypothetical protein
MGSRRSKTGFFASDRATGSFDRREEHARSWGQRNWIDLDNAADDPHAVSRELLGEG